MKITLLCSDIKHPVIEYLQAWSAAQQGFHEVELVQRKIELVGGDILFLISCSEIIDAKDVLGRFGASCQRFTKRQRVESAHMGISEWG